MAARAIGFTQEVLPESRIKSIDTIGADVSIVIGIHRKQFIHTGKEVKVVNAIMIDQASSNGIQSTKFTLRVVILIGD